MPVPFVSVVLAHHLPQNRPYLDLCIQALMRSRDVKFECLLFSDTDEDIAIHDSRIRYYKDKKLKLHSQKIHAGLDMIHSEALVLLLSDDVVVSEWCLHDMAAAFRGRELIMNPFSNSDCQSLYDAQITLHRGVEMLPLGPDMDRQALQGWEEALITYPRRERCLVATRTVSFYCTMIPRSVFERVGRLDPQLEFRHNDEDFCQRSQKFGILPCVNFGAFAFHFGSKTISKVVTREQQDQCSIAYLKKNQAPEETI